MSCWGNPSSEDSRLTYEAAKYQGMEALTHCINELNRTIRGLEKALNDREKRSWAQKQLPQTRQVLQQAKDNAKNMIEELARKNVQDAVRAQQETEASANDRESEMQSPSIGTETDGDARMEYLYEASDQVSHFVVDRIQSMIDQATPVIRAASSYLPTNEGTFVHQHILIPVLKEYLTEVMGFKEGSDYTLAKSARAGGGIDVQLNMFGTQIDLKVDHERTRRDFGAYKGDMQDYYERSKTDAEGHTYETGLATRLWFYHINRRREAHVA